MEDLIMRLVCMAPIGISVVVVGLHVYFRVKNAPAHSAHLEQLRAGRLADRLGLTVVEGDPSFVMHDVGSPVPTRRRLVLQGAPAAAGGLHLELFYSYQRTDRPGLSETEVEILFECRLTAFANGAFPAFEVFPRGPYIPEKAPLLPAATTGHEWVDRAYVVRTKEPRMATLLAQHLVAAHPTLGEVGMHVYGDGQRVSFFMHEKQAPFPSRALTRAEDVARLVVDLARAVGG
ncbi:MAG: hypothetical protein RLP09_28660 [Sandaracinaceae bacterium]|nr:hypothetical protein [Myxococcales bacterium]